MTDRHLPTENRRAFWPALILAVWNVASAPFLTDMIVEPIRDSMDLGRFISLVGGGAALIGVAVVVAGFLHLKQQRWSRLALIAAGLALVAVYVLRSSDRASAEVAVVEYLHFVSYGFLAALLVVPMAKLRALLPLGVFSTLLTVALLDEFMQWLVPARTGEFFDIALNLYAGLVGLLVGVGLFTLTERRGDQLQLRVSWRPEAAQASGLIPSRSAAVSILAPGFAIALFLMATFVQVVHLGYEIDDPEVGIFRSFFPAERLLELNEARAIQWGLEEPGELTPFEKEDWFRTQAGWHTVARNVAAAQEDWTTALSENRVLEAYYGAFLDTHDRAGNPHRYPAVQVSAMRAKAEPILAESYRSTADNGRIWLAPSPLTLWLWTALGLALLFVGWTRGRG